MEKQNRPIQDKFNESSEIDFDYISLREASPEEQEKAMLEYLNKVNQPDNFTLYLALRMLIEGAGIEYKPKIKKQSINPTDPPDSPNPTDPQG